MQCRGIIIALLLLIPLCGCDALLGYDNRDEIARAVVFSPPPKGEGAFYTDKIFSAALLAKFPVGSDPANLKSFVTSLDGRCEEPYGRGMRCFIPERGGFCFAQSIDIYVEFKNDTIFDLNAVHDGAGC